MKLTHEITIRTLDAEGMIASRTVALAPSAAQAEEWAGNLRRALRDLGCAPDGGNMGAAPRRERYARVEVAALARRPEGRK